MTDDENRDESEDELRRRAEESFNTGMEAYEHGDWRGALERFERALALYRGVPAASATRPPACSTVVLCWASWVIGGVRWSAMSGLWPCIGGVPAASTTRPTA